MEIEYFLKKNWTGGGKTPRLSFDGEANVKRDTNNNTKQWCWKIICKYNCLIIHIYRKRENTQCYSVD
jgi:hypothetical protein